MSDHPAKCLAGQATQPDPPKGIMVADGLTVQGVSTGSVGYDMMLHPRLKEILQSPRFSTVDLQILEKAPLDIESAANIGINVVNDSATPRILVTDPFKSVGRVEVNARFESALIYIDNRNSEGQLHASLNIHGEQTQCIFDDAGSKYVALHILNMRSHNQNFFFGKDSTAVGISIEMEGEDAVCVVGEDALISSGVWLRNHDMHSVLDLETGRIVNITQHDILLERHVWLGQDVLAVGAQHIGFGAIVGARSFLKRPVPPKCIAGGTPARIIRENMSWGRQNGHVSKIELALLEELSAVTT
jgi:hypothetical protein